MLYTDSICPPSEERKPQLIKQKQISLSEEQIIMNYMQELLLYSMKEAYPSHAGQVYVVRSSNGPTTIWFYDTWYHWNGYKEMKNKLFRE
ncbi:hypothetical protein H8B15_14525 [Hymenobacter sp. BT507]|uniref:Uncharacterized protein n=1 Tax=Hymenobacter citatus TaxID=2763506 RepID=A0ABR7MM44_9BACT|nr:hypothetical protein [Hymenobacter citatus]MBC6612140.1 hypothetical protein [Hymenobacter citatus]